MTQITEAELAVRAEHWDDKTLKHYWSEECIAFEEGYASLWALEIFNEEMHKRGFLDCYQPKSEREANE